MGPQAGPWAEAQVPLTSNNVKGNEKESEVAKENYVSRYLSPSMYQKRKSKKEENLL